MRLVRALGETANSAHVPENGGSAISTCMKAPLGPHVRGKSRYLDQHGSGCRTRTSAHGVDPATLARLMPSAPFGVNVDVMRRFVARKIRHRQHPKDVGWRPAGVVSSSGVRSSLPDDGATRYLASDSQIRPVDPGVPARESVPHLTGGLDQPAVWSCPLVGIAHLPRVTSARKVRRTVVKITGARGKASATEFARRAALSTMGFARFGPVPARSLSDQPASPLRAGLFAVWHCRVRRTCPLLGQLRRQIACRLGRMRQ
jgi:hypothetical protein